MKKKIIAIIPARAGSKRIKFKNLKKIKNKSLIEHVIKILNKTKIFKDIFVSTDSTKIKNISIKNNAKVPFLRNKSLSNDTASTRSVILNMIKYLEKINYEFDYIMCAYPTSIFITKKKLNEGLRLINKDNNNFSFSAKVTDTFIERSFEVKSGKVYKSVKKKYIKSRSNKLKQRYVDAGQFYFGTKKLFKSKKTSLNKNSNIVKYNKFECVDINDNEDFNFAKKIFISP